MRVAAAVSCYHMSSLTRTRVIETQQDEDCENTLKRRRNTTNSDNHFCKKVKQEENMTDTTNQKRANFSALTPSSNGINRTIPSIVNLKPGAAKKLVIKNFKGRP